MATLNVMCLWFLHMKTYRYGPAQIEPVCQWVMDVEAGYPKVFVMVMEKSILFLGFAALFLKSFL